MARWWLLLPSIRWWIGPTTLTALQATLFPSTDTILLAVAAASLLPLLLGWVAYPFWIGRLALRHRSGGTTNGMGRTVTCVLATRDAPEVVAARISNLLDSDYPAELLQLVIAVDYRAPYTPAAYANALGDAVVIVPGDAPGGKAAALNAGVRAATGEVLLLVDSRQTFSHDTISALLRGFDLGRFAAVSGVVALEREDRVMRWYWDYEIGIRRAQAARRSLVTTSGAITALRRDVWQPLPAGAICDDLFLTIGLAERGYRVGLVEAALAHDPRQLARRDRFDKKVRTLTGLVQFIRWNPSALLPWRNPVWADFYAHKLLRLVTPPLLALATLCLGAWLVRNAERAQWIILIEILAVIAVAGALRPRESRRVLSGGLWMLTLLAAPVLALANGARGTWDVWRPHPPTPARGGPPRGGGAVAT